MVIGMNKIIKIFTFIVMLILMSQKNIYIKLPTLALLFVYLFPNKSLVTRIYLAEIKYSKHLTRTHYYC